MPFRPRRPRRSKKPMLRRKPATLAKSTALAVKKIVSSHMKRVVETKHADYALQPIAPSSLYHNVWYQLETDPFYMQMGVTDTDIAGPLNRIGDSIFAKKIWYRLFLDKYNTRPNICLRIVILKQKPGLSMPANITSHTQGLNNLINPIRNEEVAYISTVYDKVFVLNGGVAEGSAYNTHFNFNYNVKVNKKIKYEDGALTASGPFVYVPYILAYDSVASLTSDNVARFSFFRRTYFEDS